MTDSDYDHELQEREFEHKKLCGCTYKEWIRFCALFQMVFYGVIKLIVSGAALVHVSTSMSAKDFQPLRRFTSTTPSILYGLTITMLVTILLISIISIAMGYILLKGVNEGKMSFLDLWKTYSIFQAIFYLLTLYNILSVVFYTLGFFLVYKYMLEMTVLARTVRMETSRVKEARGSGLMQNKGKERASKEPSISRPTNQVGPENNDGTSA